MDFVVVGWIGIAVMVALILLGVPIGFALGGVGFAGVAVLVGVDRALGVLNTVPYSSVAYFMWIAVPLFVLMGNFAFYGGVVTDLFRAARNWFGWMPGGLAIATVWGCAGFGAACGSSVAGAATMGQIALPEMLKHNYSPRLSTGCIASAGSLASLIPPSILMIVYGAITDTSVGKLFMAGFIPGILSAALYMIMILFIAKRDPQIGPAIRGVSWEERFSSLKGLTGTFIIAFIVMGGIYGGVCTPTEAAGLGAAGALILALGKRKLTKNTFWQSLKDAVATNCTLFVIVIGSMIFAAFMAISGVPRHLSNLIIGSGLSPYGVLFAICLLYLFLGCILEPVGMCLLTMPVIFPTIRSLGFDPIWFGILFIKLAEIGMITPPVGLNVYVLKGVAPDHITLEEIFRGIIPFLYMELFTLGVLIGFPQISLWLPSMMK